jgi:putative membrane-bound dehydrogenase-like protein
MRLRSVCAGSAAAFALLLAQLSPSSEAPSASGPETEKRFPPLQVPPGFKATLFACDPLVEYPSVIALGPRPGTLFVAADYLTGLGHEIIRRDEVRLLEDTNGDGYADKQTVIAAGFNSIQGLAYHDGTLYVMNAPYLTAVRLKHDGAAEEGRQQLLRGLGLAPEVDQIRLHNANGVVVGHDGWLYLALGDRGCKVTRPEGDALVLEGGGILRCRPDGRDLHVFATGLRNIYDVALDDELNVFVRDNENDGGAYKVRVCHSFFGADHGYPYLYYERPDEALPPLADLGLGSSAGGVCYLEQQFPAEYRGNLFFCEWGRAVVRSTPRRSGSSFAPIKETDFAFGAANDPYGFKPTDLVVDRDGALFVADWADGQRPRRGRGRIYRLTYQGKPAENPNAAGLDGLVAQLDSESHHRRVDAQEALARRGRDGLARALSWLDDNRLGVRGRLHAVWLLTRCEGRAALGRLYALAAGDRDPRVRAQAVRAVADLVDPILVQHRLDASAKDHADAERIASLAVGQDPRVMLEAIIALGRLGWPDAPSWLEKNAKALDPALAHAAQWALRRSRNWPALLKLLDEPDTHPLRAVARRALAGQYEAQVIDGLIRRLENAPRSPRCAEYADLLSRVHQKPGAWTYWGFRPGPRPANSVSWERTLAIEQALDDALAGSQRLEVLRHMQRERVPARTATLARWLEGESRPDQVGAILAALAARPAAESQPLLQSVLSSPKQTLANRLKAVALFLGSIDGRGDKLLAAAQAVEDGPVLVELLRPLATHPSAQAAAFLSSKVASPDPAVRAAALAALAEQKTPEASAAASKLLDDADVAVRAAAAQAVGKLTLKSAADRLMELTRDQSPEVRRASLGALGRLRDRRALPLALAALGERATALKALEYLAEVGSPEHTRPLIELARREPSLEVLAGVGQALKAWLSRDRLSTGERRLVLDAVAEIQGHSGMLLAWQVAADSPEEEVELLVLAAGAEWAALAEDAPRWDLVMSAGMEGRVRLKTVRKAPAAFVAVSDVVVDSAAVVEVFTASTGLETIRLNDQVVFQRQRPGVIGPYPDHFEASLRKGRNRVVVRLSDAKAAPEFQLRFRRKSARPEHERLARAALSRAGNPANGRQVFLNAEKSQCVKCHRVGELGERIGPELTGLGSRFAKVYIIESILEPSRTIAPSFETLALVLKNGRVLHGIKTAETDGTLTLVDNQAQKHVVNRSEIETQQVHPLSTMPEGLEKRLTEDEFVDLVSFLVNLKTN